MFLSNLLLTACVVASEIHGGATAVADSHLGEGHPCVAAVVRRIEAVVRRVAAAEAVQTSHKIADYYQRTGCPGAAAFHRLMATRRESIP